MLPMLSRTVEEFLLREAFDYKKSGINFLLVMACNGRKWQTVLNCSEEILSCISVFPWPAAPESAAEIYRELNDWNLEQRAGCFVLNDKDHKISFQLGVPVLDPYSADEYIKRALTASASVLEFAWERVFRLAVKTKDKN